MALLGGIAMAGICAAVARTRTTGPTTSVDRPSPVLVSDETVQISIDSSPSGAVIHRAGSADPIGRTPFRMRLKKGEGAFDVLLFLDGWNREIRTISPDRSQDLLVNLTKAEPPARTQTTVTPKPSAMPPRLRQKHPAKTPASEEQLDDGLL